MQSSILLLPTLYPRLHRDRHHLLSSPPQASPGPTLKPDVAGKSLLRPSSEDIKLCADHFTCRVPPSQSILRIIWDKRINDTPAQKVFDAMLVSQSYSSSRFHFASGFPMCSLVRWT
ncbi:hypothetical protein E2562_031185 [Oryza meyeriana var. granulata]|uniref:Uncharacterized protein n=1 Tax=Oryza meyeriana var. granulata TaxID=110450 RepID=A0A6G1ERK0_9ORYZ|nr:hypothetical protein E2562_031185 [Oryza meyeriana var. granulata]KAF0927246.1 hypothetical protein E2562_031185 [Oryza meyeriana var. granulata]KAF0927252.1 hypothetical protein E2562_031185 [Oryza meyeriana var. granulata]KAF0927254.1 hypothetical protein E2562_031185 [Oryza meyeriana var. granulata]